MLAKIGKFKRRLIRRFSRSELISRWMGFETNVPPSHEPGLIVLQVDGLSRRQFEAAVGSGRLPFLKKMIDRGYFDRMSFYSGVPSCTPAVQAEVMYGVKGAVPAFQFLHRESGKVVCMYEHDAIAEVVKQKFATADPLLKSGASFSNIYSGGSEEARCCIETADLASTFKGINPIHFLLMLLMYSFTLLRIGILAAIEVLVAVVDLVRGLWTRSDWRSEFKFVPARVLISIVLREWVRVVMKLSIARGVPVMYANLLGYDEQAHRRGPKSAFAHWGLKGIDKVIKDIFLTARRSDRRDYEVVVFSDHGQEDVVSYEFAFQQTVQQAVTKALETGPLAERIVHNIDPVLHHGSYMDQNMRRLLKIKKGRRPTATLTPKELAEHVVVTAMGPIGHVYFPVPVTDEDIAAAADTLVNEQHVPLVVYKLQTGEILGRNARGLWSVAEDFETIAGSQHRFASEVQEDLLSLCDHPDIGDLILLGWDPDEPPISFAAESGAHGSIGTAETRGFALLPTIWSLKPRHTLGGEAYVRGIDLHAAGLAFLRSQSMSDVIATSEPAIPEHNCNAVPHAQQTADSSESQTSTKGTQRLRIMTYNTHHCIGMDGKCRPQRIAQVIAAAKADVVCLQEMDENRLRSNHRDQTSEIAAELGMYHRFFPVWSNDSERYGLAILSRFPIASVREDTLTDADHRTRREARGAIWVTVETDVGPVHVINTHLGLRAKERVQQVEELLSDRWLADVEQHEPVLLCGDLNAGPNSAVLQSLLKRFHCAQMLADDHQPQATFASILPLRRIDYILLSRHIVVEHVSVLKNHTTSVASDHLPLVAEVTVHHDTSFARHSKTDSESHRSLPHSTGQVVSTGGLAPGAQL